MTNVNNFQSTVKLGPYSVIQHVCNSNFIAGSLESANSSILAARRLFKDFGGEKIRILC